MKFSKIQFISLLISLVVVPIIVFNLVWIFKAKAATGIMCFMGKSQDGQLVRSYPVIMFSSTGKDTIFFHGKTDTQLNPGDHITILYQKNDPTDARINDFDGLWIDTIIYAGIPFIILMMIFLHRAIIPWGSTVELGKKPFIKILNKENPI